ncbi:MAG: hypothetical protein U0822_08390 [Anaerolineae bacterium]
MRLAIKRRVPAPAQQLVEIVTPRTNTATLTAAENLLAGLAHDEPFSLEIASANGARWFLARAWNETVLGRVQQQVRAAYPQADLRPLDVERVPSLDPALQRQGEQVAVGTLALRAGAELPLRTFSDDEPGDSNGSQADPLLGILSALDDLPDGWRALSQIVLRPAPDRWCEPYQRLAVEPPPPRYTAQGADTSLNNVYLMAVLLAVVAVGLQAYDWYLDHHWLPLALLGLTLVVAIPALVWLVRRLRHKPVSDTNLIREKIKRPAYVAEVRLAIFAPSDVPRPQLEARLTQIAAAYKQFNLAAGNGLVLRRVKPANRNLRCLAPLTPARSLPLLNVRELAGLWHLPHAHADVPLLERTTARRRLPLPATVACGCPVGVSSHQGRSVAVALPDSLLARHLLLVAKTRRGKSSLLLQIARYIMEHPVADRRPSTLVLVDPHRDLARAALGQVPPHRHRDVVYLDVSDTTLPFGLNLLDVGLGWDRDKAVSNTLAVFENFFIQYWGPRMEDVFRYCLLALFEANAAICAADPNGRDRQYTVLDVAGLLTDKGFRQMVVEQVADPIVKRWFVDYFEPLERRLRMEIINPVQTKVQRFAASHAARLVVGQSRSTIDPAAWLRDRSIVIVNTAMGMVGQDTAALIGGTLINLVRLVIYEQMKVDTAQRHPVTLIVDEFHTMPGAQYESILSELGKYGANLILATQSLSRLEAMETQERRGVRGAVFSNLDGLFAFQTSGEDAHYLVDELGGGLEVQDVMEMGDYQCYARLTLNGERVPTFSLRLNPPPTSDRQVQEALAAESAERYGRDHEVVEADLLASLGRIEQAHDDDDDKGKSNGKATDARSNPDGPASKPKGQKRSQNRNQPKNGHLPGDAPAS